MNNNNDDKHNPRVTINPPASGTILEGATHQKDEALALTKPGAPPSQKPQEHPVEYIDIWEKRFRDSLAILEHKNSTGQQDRREDDPDLAPVYLEVLYRQLARNKDISPDARPYIFLDSAKDLTRYVNQEYERHIAEGSAWPLRQRAAVALAEGDHHVAFDIYGDENGLSILVIDSLIDPVENFEEVKEYVQAGVQETGVPIKSLLCYSTCVQNTGFDYDIDVCHVLKQLIKKAPEITRLHKENFSPATMEKGEIHIIEEDDARRLLPLEFLKPMQDVALLNELLEDLPEVNEYIVTHKPGREETLADFKHRVFQEMLAGDGKSPHEKLLINTVSQRMRTRLYRDTLDFIAELKETHGENASAVLRKIVERNAPMRPAEWARAIPSWINAGSDDEVKGPILLLNKLAQERLAEAPMENQKKMISELLQMLSTAKSPTLQLAGLGAIQKWSEDSLQTEDIEEAILVFTQLKVRWRNQAGNLGEAEPLSVMDEIIEAMIFRNLTAKEAFKTEYSQLVNERLDNFLWDADIPSESGNLDQKWLEQNRAKAERLLSESSEAQPFVEPAHATALGELERLKNEKIPASRSHKRMQSEQIDPLPSKRQEADPTSQTGIAIPIRQPVVNEHGLSNRDIQVISKWLRGRQQTRFKVTVLEDGALPHTVKLGTSAFALTEDGNRILLRTPRQPNDETENILVVKKQTLLQAFPRLEKQLQNNDKEILLTPGVTLSGTQATPPQSPKKSPGKKR